MSDNFLNEIAEFAIKNGGELYTKLDWNVIKSFAKKHLDYKTIIIVRDKEGILAVCRWNMVTPKTAHILDLIIRKGHKYQSLIKRILTQGKKVFPEAEEIVFEREHKYPNRKLRKYLIKDILKRRK